MEQFIYNVLNPYNLDPALIIFYVVLFVVVIPTAAYLTVKVTR